MGKRHAYVTGIIPNGAAISGEIAIGGLEVVGIILPTITSAAVTLQASADGVTFADVFNAAGELSFGASTGARLLTSVDLPRGVQSIKVRSGTAAAPVNQGADRTITVVVAGG